MWSGEWHFYLHQIMTLLNYMARANTRRHIYIYTACRLWPVPWHGWGLLLQTQRRYDSCQVDSSWGCFVQEVHHKEWCVELWDGDVRDMVTGTQAFWGVQHWRGEECDVFVVLLMQTRHQPACIALPTSMYTFPTISLSNCERKATNMWTCMHE